MEAPPTIHCCQLCMVAQRWPNVPKLCLTLKKGDTDWLYNSVGCGTFFFFFRITLFWNNCLEQATRGSISRGCECWWLIYWWNFQGSLQTVLINPTSRRDFQTGLNFEQISSQNGHKAVANIWSSKICYLYNRHLSDERWKFLPRRICPDDIKLFFGVCLCDLFTWVIEFTSGPSLFGYSNFVFWYLHRNSHLTTNIQGYNSDYPGIKTTQVINKNDLKTG